MRVAKEEKESVAGPTARKKTVDWIDEDG